MAKNLLSPATAIKLALTLTLTLTLCGCSPAHNPLAIENEIVEREEESLTTQVSPENQRNNRDTGNQTRQSLVKNQRSSLIISEGISLSQDQKKIVINKDSVHAEYKIVGRLSGNYRVFGGGNPRDGTGENIFAHLDFFGMVLELSRSQSIKNEQDCEINAVGQSQTIAMIVPNPSDLDILTGRKLDGQLHLEGYILEQEMHNYKGSPIGLMGGYSSGPIGMPDMSKAWLITNIKGAGTPLK